MQIYQKSKHSKFNSHVCITDQGFQTGAAISVCVGRVCVCVYARVHVLELERAQFGRRKLEKDANDGLN